MLAREPDLLTKPEAAQKLRVSPSTLDRLRAHGEIAWVPDGRQVRFLPEARQGSSAGSAAAYLRLATALLRRSPPDRGAGRGIGQA